MRMSVEKQAELRAAAEREGMYRPELEHDACGMGFVAHIKGVKSHSIVANALAVLEHLTHRGATGCDPCTGDGAGILVQVPDRFFRKVCPPLGIELPEARKYAVGMLFMPHEPKLLALTQAAVEKAIVAEGFKLLGSRDVPVDPSACGDIARETLPVMRQVFVAPTPRSSSASCTCCAA
jgi:glutamate synthase domain-containing protein 1